MHDEIEVKFRISDPEDMRSKLKKTGAYTRGSVTERNITFDGKEGEFGNDMKMLRVRDDGKVTITYKGESQKSRFKHRKELDLNTDDFSKSVEMLKSLGFQPAWSYEKVRENWFLGKALISIDRLPNLGYWLEIEGSEEDIDKTIEALGLNPGEGITKTYRKIFQEYCEHNNMEFQDMVFKNGLQKTWSKSRA
jgi:adenylate cyclase class 2